jgi:bifunctional DNase/RNase
MKFKVSVLTAVALFSCLTLVAQRHDEGVEVKVTDLVPTRFGVSLTLRASDSSGDIHMLVGLQEGQSIARAMHNNQAERPMSHDLFKSFLDRNGWRVQRVLIRDLKDGTFFADMTVEKDSQTQVYDARPSDAMAIGLRFGAKIFVNRRVFEEQKQSEGDEDREETPNEPETLKL